MVILPQLKDLEIPVTKYNFKKMHETLIRHSGPDIDPNQFCRG